MRGYLMRLGVAVFAGALTGLPGLAMAAPSTPTADFVDNGDATVTHLKTGLTWMRCAVGQVWSGATCTGNATPHSAATAAQAVAATTLGGYGDWRLPTVAELDALVEREADSPTLNSKVFPGAPADSFLSATPYFQMPGYSWVVNFANGSDGSGRGSYFLRLVRGGETPDSTAPSAPSADFLDNRDGTLTHRKTGLTWMRCAVGKTWTGSTCTGTSQFMSWHSAVALAASFAGYGDWRLPSVDELKSLVEYTARNPALNAALFPTPPNLWSADQVVAATNFLILGKPTQVLSATSEAYFLNAAYGLVGSMAKTASYNGALLVRGEQARAMAVPPRTAVALAVNCPAAVAGGTLVACTASATFNDFTVAAVAAQWTVSDAAALGVRNDGTLVPANVQSDTAVTVSASYGEGETSLRAAAALVVKPAPVTLAGLLIAGEGSVVGGASIAMKSTAAYSNGTSTPVTPVWRVSDASVATISRDGLLTATAVVADTPVTVTASYAEGGITQTAVWTVTVKAPALRFSLLPGSLQAAPGGAFTLTAQNGALQSCVSSNPAAVSTPQVDASGATASATVAPDAAAGERVTVSCTSACATVAQASITVSARLSASERLFDWAESAYPSLFAPPGASTQTAMGYTYRYYSQQNCYLAIKDGRVYYLGTLSDERISDVGALDDYLQQASAAGF